MASIGYQLVSVAMLALLLMAVDDYCCWLFVLSICVDWSLKRIISTHRRFVWLVVYFSSFNRNTISKGCNKYSQLFDEFNLNIFMLSETFPAKSIRNHLFTFK